MYNLGCYAMDDRNYPRPVVRFKEALGAEPDDTRWANDALAYNDLGYAYLQLGQISNAVAEFRQGHRNEPRYPEAYYNLGLRVLEQQAAGRGGGLLPTRADDGSALAAIHNKLANALTELGRMPLSHCRVFAGAKTEPEHG